MSSKLVVKDNALINASYSLSLVEQRLVLLAIIEARKANHKKDYSERLTITANSYMQQFDVERQTAYEMLRQACDKLFERRFSYQEQRDDSVANITSRWVSEVGYIQDKAVVEIVFAPAVIPLITELEKHFTSYEIEQVAGLNSGYAVRLYEILIAWRGVGAVPEIELQELRERLGVEPNEYQRMHHFKARVLDLAISQINEHTDITAQYEQHKTGRKITGISFTFNHKTKPVKQVKLTPKQIETYSGKLARLSSLGSKSPKGASYDDYAKQIAGELKTDDGVKKYLPYLIEAGFKAGN